MDNFYLLAVNGRSAIESKIGLDIDEVDATNDTRWWRKFITTDTFRQLITLIKAKFNKTKWWNVFQTWVKMMETLEEDQTDSLRTLSPNLEDMDTSTIPYLSLKMKDSILNYLSQLNYDNSGQVIPPEKKLTPGSVITVPTTLQLQPQIHISTGYISALQKNTIVSATATSAGASPKLDFASLPNQSPITKDGLETISHIYIADYDSYRRLQLRGQIDWLNAYHMRIILQHHTGEKKEVLLEMSSMINANSTMMDQIKAIQRAINAELVENGAETILGTRPRSRENQKWAKAFKH